jgi:hypothetical protein
MTILEKAIINGARTAQKNYQEFTGGYWLSYGPESFLVHTVVKSICEEGYCGFPEASPKLISKALDLQKSRGRPPKNLDQRFDTVVWNKAGNYLKAIIEVKKAWSISSLRSDRNKIKKYLESNRNHFDKAVGYLLAYTEAKRADTLQNRFPKWAKELKCKLCHHHVETPENEEWGWSVGLLRLKNDI